MRGPSIQRTAALSAVLHLTVFLLSYLVLHYSHRVHLPSPYVVHLVDSGNRDHSLKKQAGGKKETVTAAKSEKEHKRTAGMKDVSSPAEKSVQKDTSRDKIDERRIEDSIGALRAKKDIARRQELREMISIGKSGAGGDEKSSSIASENAQGRGGQASYIDRISEEIWRAWEVWELGEKSLEAVIAVKIMRDGTLSVRGIEKSSGNRFFDRSALQAIAKASPVAPPPHEMEIGIRFYP